MGEYNGQAPSESGVVWFTALISGHWRAKGNSRSRRQKHLIRTRPCTLLSTGFILLPYEQEEENNGHGSDELKGFPVTNEESYHG